MFSFLKKNFVSIIAVLGVIVMAFTYGRKYVPTFIEGTTIHLSDGSAIFSVSVDSTSSWYYSDNFEKASEGNPSNLKKFDLTYLGVLLPSDVVKAYSKETKNAVLFYTSRNKTELANGKKQTVYTVKVNDKFVYFTECKDS